MTNDQGRRNFIQKLSLSITGILGLMMATPLATVFIESIKRKNKMNWYDLGPTEKFQLKKTLLTTYERKLDTPNLGGLKYVALYVRRTSESEFQAFSVNCRHLGCPVRWEEKASLFLCPCHGGVYYEDGRVAAGPPQEPLQKLALKVVKGRLYVKDHPTTLNLSTKESV